MFNRAIRALVLCVFCTLPVTAFASGNSNNSDSCGDLDLAVECRDYVEGDVTATSAVCGNLSITKQKQICDADAICAQHVEQVCGDVVSVCNSDDTLFSIATAVAKSRAACMQAHETVQATSVDCSQASLACGDVDTDVTNHNECPPVNVTVDEADVDCVRCMEKRTYFPDGSVKSTRQRCFKCSVNGTLELN